MDANLEVFERAVDAINRRDVDALVEQLDPDVRWHDVFGVMLGGEAAVYRGHEGVRELFQDLFGAFADTHSDYPDIRIDGDLVIATGTLRVRGTESGAGVETPVGTVAQFKNGKAIRVRTFLDPEDGFEAAF
jgi:ketosteroid isomerase-like protein